MSKPLTAKQLKEVESYRDSGFWTAEQCARLRGLPSADVLRIYAERKR